ncbi:phosphatidylserine decarboxylase proenzyme, mitochondrial-like [Acridotheres tristis]
MAAAAVRSSLLCSCNLLVHKNLCIRAGVLWKQPPSRTFFSDRKKLHTAPVGQVFRLRPFHVLVATGGGYAGYRKYEDYKLEQLEKRGIEESLICLYRDNMFLTTHGTKISVTSVTHFG